MEDLNDPLGDRVMKNVPPMARDPLIRSKLWHKSSKYWFFDILNTFSCRKIWRTRSSKYGIIAKPFAQRRASGKSRIDGNTQRRNEHHEEGAKCAEDQRASHYCWRYSWIILRFNTHV